MLSRRRFALLIGGLPSLALSGSAASGIPGADQSPNAQPLSSFDTAVQDFMKARNIPGGALAIVKDKQLVYARGYGWADRDNQRPVRPNSLFRIASLSKPVTAIAVLKLFEEGLFDIKTPVLDLLCSASWMQPGTNIDPRWKRITVLNLLQHTGGWDSTNSFDPMFRARQIARALGVTPPAGPEAIVRRMLAQPLDFEPGTRYAYSNFGYCLLGRIIEHASGMHYEQYVKKHILATAGIERMRLGATLESDRAVDEVHYYTANSRMVQSVFQTSGGESDSKHQVPEPYGGFYLEAMDAHGGWLASVVDLARLSAALDNPQRCPILKPETVQTMYKRPEPPLWCNADGSLTDYYYGCGWLVRPIGKDGQANYWHNGSLPGTYSLWVRRWDGLDWIVLFNQRSDDPALPDADIDPALHRAADEVADAICSRV